MPESVSRKGRKMTGQTLELERPERVVEHSPGLTHSLDYSKEGLAVNATRTCSIDGCSKPRGHGRAMYCEMHYYRIRRDGEAGSSLPKQARLPRGAHHLWSRIQPTGFCWEWTGRITPDGYGRLNIARQQVLAHRAVWEELVGCIPEGMVIDHLCRNRKCVNPDHLEPVTPAENMRRGVYGVLGHCHEPKTTGNQEGTQQ